MAKKIFGGSKNGRFSGSRGSNSNRPEPIPEEAKPFLEEATPEEPAQIAENPTPAEASIPEEAVLTQEEAVPAPEESVQTQEEADQASEESDQTPEEVIQTPEEVDQTEFLDTEAEDEEPRQEKKSRASRKQKKASPLKVVSILLSVILFLELAYCLVIFTDLIPPIAKLRSIYIETAMSTMRHQWLAKALIPGDIVQEVIDNINQSKADQVQMNSGWEDVTEAPPADINSPSSGFSKDAAATMLGLLAQDIGLSNEIDDFFELFHELDEESVMAFVEAHPEAIAGGWDKFWVNESGLNDEGTTMKTKQGDQVLAVDAENGLMVMRITGPSYRGVMVIGKDPSRLKCAPSAYWGSQGQRAGEIAEAHDGLVAMSGSGFNDDAPVGEGGSQSGGAMFSGVARGTHYPWGYKRVELHLDNRLYIANAHEGYGKNCTDATEWTPALIVDGKIVVSDSDGYTALNPRACIGQTKDEAILFLGIEGRNIDSVGCDASECAEILARYNAYQGMNVDGGTSAIMWYQGEYIMKCSNESLPEGRRLPNAWVYCTDTVPDPEL